MSVLLLLLAHLIADFWLQTDSMINNKMKHIKKHMLHHLITTGLALIIIWGYTYHFSKVINYLVFPLLFICVTHLIIDVLKLKLLDTIKPIDSHDLKKLGFFLVDQALHLATLIITCIVFFDVKATTMMTRLLQLLGENGGTNGLNVVNTLLFIIIIFILATSVSGHMIKLILGSLPSELANFEAEFTFKNKTLDAKNSSESRLESNFTEEYHYLTYSNPLLSRGKLIGYIERLLVILLTIVGAYPSIAFIIAAKSIARFKQLDDRNWAEYFLLGTLSSIFLGLLLGLLVRAIVM
ncbi:DUF3307 domain-containing protein [Sporosarcina sp. G11-34]|uniref:DUF3307 domain-containing protein n=1 Tax=Sporosarcina sp. G11-34 TaxID=2849605 RepID=UPI0022A8FD0D|nr:DUF3307 domain-containing protein [Sporosarcina sp. G11-34]MCZ2258149.1 DUF3307 domain-containing protein [Sporosarcina sp. G11-34]